MHTMFDRSTSSSIRERITHLNTSMQPQWGKMNVAQAVAHLATSMEEAIGDRLPPRMFVGRILGPLVRRRALRDDAPISRNAPTAPGLVIADQRDLEAERTRLLALVDRWVAAGPAGATSHPHCFFGKLTPDEWGRLTYKHLDHHLRQFGA